MKVRKITELDLPELAGLYTELMHEEIRPEMLADNFTHYQSLPEYLILGIDYEGELVGSILGIICHDLMGAFMVVENVIVGSKFRRHGLGRLLMEAVEEIAWERGCYYIMLVSGEQRREAHQLYGTLGYQIDPVRGFRKKLDLKR